MGRKNERSRRASATWLRLVERALGASESAYLAVSGSDRAGRVQEQVMDAGHGTLVEASFDSLTESIYTWSDEGKDQFLYTKWP
jgi:hypothetical protein